MAEVKIEKIREAFEAFESAFESAAAQLDQRDKISIERATTMDAFEPKNARGGIGLLYGGSSYEKTTRGPALIMKRIMKINLLLVAKYIDNPNIKTEAVHTMMPAEYVDFIIDAFSGIKVFNHLPEYENKTYPVQDEIVGEANNEWRYLVTIAVPVDYVEPNIRKNF